MLPFGRSMAAKCRWKNQRWMAYSGDASASSSNERTRSELLTPAVRKRSSMVFIALLVVADMPPSNNNRLTSCTMPA